MSENSRIDVNTTFDYVIIISCTDETDTTFFNLTLRFTSKENPDPGLTDTLVVIISASICGLLLLVVIMVVFVRKWQHKNKYNIRKHKIPQELFHIRYSGIPGESSEA